MEVSIGNSPRRRTWDEISTTGFHETAHHLDSVELRNY
jgi:hypothetical protein